MIVAKKNTEYYLSFPAIDSTTPDKYKSGISPIDTAYYKDGAGVWLSLAIANAATEIGTTGVYEITLTASEMNHDKVLIKFSTSGMADDAYNFDLVTKIVSDLNDVSTSQVNTECDAALAVYDAPTKAELDARTLPSANYFDPAVDAVANVTNITNLHADAATATSLATVDSKVTGIQTDLSNSTDGLGALKTSISAIPTTDNSTNISNILADTNELQIDWVNGGRLDLLVDQVLSNLTALNNVSVADINAQVVDVLKTDTIAELPVGIPTATPSIEQALMYIYMALRNKIDVTATVKEFHNDAGAIIWKKVLSDNGTTYTEAEGISG